MLSGNYFALAVDVAQYLHQRAAVSNDFYVNNYYFFDILLVEKLKKNIVIMANRKKNILSPFQPLTSFHHFDMTLPKSLSRFYNYVRFRPLLRPQWTFILFLPGDRGDGILTLD